MENFDVYIWDEKLRTYAKHRSLHVVNINFKTNQIFFDGVNNG